MEIISNLKEIISDDPLYFSLICIIIILSIVLIYYSIIYIKNFFQNKDNSNSQIKKRLIKKRLDMKEPSNIKREKEVFNISDNIYTYYDAKALCKAYNAELASYDQVNNALKEGAEWCNYGWSKNQMALYPTQKETWERMQKGAKRYRDDCGRPGINGGYFDDPKLRFGVNCYGIKPKPTNKDLKLLNYRPMPGLSKKEIEFNKRVNEFKKNIKENTILPFKPYNWTKYNNNIGDIYTNSDLKKNNSDIEKIESGFSKAEKKLHNIDQTIIKGAKKFGNTIDKGLNTIGDEMLNLNKKI